MQTRAATFFVLFIFLIHAIQCQIACTELNYAQYTCDEVEISETTFEAVGCDKTRRINVTCTVLDGVNCTGSKQFNKTESCTFTYAKKNSINKF